MADQTAPETSDAAKPGRRRRVQRLSGIARVERIFFVVTDSVSHLIAALASLDKPSRRAAILFFLSFTGLVSSAYLVWDQARTWEKEILFDEYSKKGSRAEAKKSLQEAISREKMETRTQQLSTEVGKFIVHLKVPAGTPVSRGVLNLAELHLTLECDMAEACDFLRSHMDQARDQISEVFSNVRKDEIVSLSGKRSIKRRIMRRLNVWISRGRVTEIYFTHLLIS